MFKFRIFSFIGLLALLGWILVAPMGRPVLYFLAMPLGAMVVYEVLAMLEKAGLPGKLRLGSGIAAVGMGIYFFAWGMKYLLPAQQLMRTLPLLGLLLVPLAMLLGWVLILTAKDRLDELKRIVVTAGVLVMTIGFLMPLLEIFLLPWLVALYFILVTKAGDTGGYIVGKLTSYLPGGNHKVVPSISPAKSWEGVAGGLALSLGVSCLFQAMGYLNWGWPMTILLGIVLYFGGFAGDLTESAVKRACGVKDSGAIIPGMGGVFDVVDSFIYNAPLFMLIISWINSSRMV